MSEIRTATLDTLLKQVEKLHNCMEKRFDGVDTELIKVIMKQDRLDSAGSIDRDNAQTQFLNVHKTLGEIKARLGKIEK